MENKQALEVLALCSDLDVNDSEQVEKLKRKAECMAFLITEQFKHESELQVADERV